MWTRGKERKNITGLQKEDKLEGKGSSHLHYKQSSVACSIHSFVLSCSAPALFFFLLLLLLLLAAPARSQRG